VARHRARLALTVAAGVLLGIERCKSGHAAGLRTTLLVSLAAAVAVIRRNLLLPANGHEVRWPSRSTNADVPRLVTEMEALSGVIEVQWKAWGPDPQ
jgi:uncharacterized membrane protein YhiD involved in acid resistance